MCVFVCFCVCGQLFMIPNEVDARPFVGDSLMVYQCHYHQSVHVFVCMAYWEPIKAGCAPVLFAVFIK